MSHKNAEMEVGGEPAMTFGGAATFPYRDEHPCFNRCGRMAQWRMDGPNLMLHWCTPCKDECEAEGKFTEVAGYIWYPLKVRG